MQTLLKMQERDSKIPGGELAGIPHPSSSTFGVFRRTLNVSVIWRIFLMKYWADLLVGTTSGRISWFKSVVTTGLLYSTGHLLTHVNLVRHCADTFLASEHKEVRIEAVRTCSRLLTPSLHVSEQEGKKECYSNKNCKAEPTVQYIVKLKILSKSPVWLASGKPVFPPRRFHSILKRSVEEKLVEVR